MMKWSLVLLCYRAHIKYQTTFTSNRAHIPFWCIFTVEQIGTILRDNPVRLNSRHPLVFFCLWVTIHGFIVDFVVKYQPQRPYFLRSCQCLRSYQWPEHHSSFVAVPKPKPLSDSSTRPNISIDIKDHQTRQTASHTWQLCPKTWQ